MFANPPLPELRQIIRTVKTIAVVGFSTRPERPSHYVAAGLKANGYQVFPVNPALTEGLGGKVYASLDELPEPPDLVDVFRQSAAVDAIVDTCIRLGFKRLWLQEGVINEQAALRAQAAAMTVVMDRCIWRELQAMQKEGV